ncbi:MAG: heme ABC exporter ATP-binding protein CcmA [Gemmatimonadetes bacterium]|nr:heme ABC exporter ATP-binding protein CcmA [Gemmatimonadota bacterium]
MPPLRPAAPAPSPAATAHVALLELERVGKAFGRRVALRDVSLVLRRGCGIALLGPNGAGKTTLLRVAAGLMAPTSGRLVVDGSPRAAAVRLRRKVGYVGHQGLLYDTLTARQNLAFFARLYGAGGAERRSREMLRRFGLERHAERRVASFSRGMRQRLALARALLHAPDILLLDEPYTGLDAEGAQLLNRELAGLLENGAALLLATHRFEVPLALAADVAVLAGGELRHAGPTTGMGAHDLASLYDRVVACSR